MENINEQAIGFILLKKLQELKEPVTSKYLSETLSIKPKTVTGYIVYFKRAGLVKMVEGNGFKWKFNENYRFLQLEELWSIYQKGK